MQYRFAVHFGTLSMYSIMLDSVLSRYPVKSKSVLANDECVRAAHHYTEYPKNIDYLLTVLYRSIFLANTTTTLNREVLNGGNPVVLCGPRPPEFNNKDFPHQIKENTLILIEKSSTGRS